MIWIVSYLFRLLPLPWAMLCGRILGNVWYYLVPIRRGVAQDNIKIALGDRLNLREQRRMVRRSFQHLVMMGIESLRMHDMTEALSKQRVRRENYEHYSAALKKGKGVIIVSGHVGNFELLACSQAVRGEPIHLVMKDFSNKSAHKFMAETRRVTKLQTIPPRRSKNIIKEKLAQNKVVGIMVDQHLRSFRALVCSFFGRLASTTPAPARFALESGAPIIPIVCYRDKRDGYHAIRVEPEFELEMPYKDEKKNLWHNTERLNRVVEEWIREFPDQYFWVHRRWKVHEKPGRWEIPPELEHLLALPPKSEA